MTVEIGAAIADSGLISTKETAELLMTTVGYVTYLRRSGTLKAYRIGRDNYYLREEVEAFRVQHPRLGSRRKA